MSQADLPSLPEDLRQAILQFDSLTSDPEPLTQSLVDWFDGRHPDELLKLLDFLRGRQAYPLSLGLLEAAWNSDLSEDRLGHIAEDWIGTVRFGVGDEEGSLEVARHVSKGAMARGPAFANDLAHLLLGWDMYDVAHPLAEFAAKELPGDLSAQYNLGVIRKLSGDWAGARASFELVLLHRDQDQSTLWNLGIVTTAQSDWEAARAAWARLGFRLPDGDGDFGSEGELTPVRLRARSGASEVIWGTRLCPARVRLKGIPCQVKWACFDDDVLIDGVTTGEAVYDGKTLPIFNALVVSESAGRSRFGLKTNALASPMILERLVQWLDEHQIPHGDWRNIGGRAPCPIALAPKSEEELSRWTSAVTTVHGEIGEWVDLDEA